jgi:phage-related baseplate assembly protein
MSARLRLAGMLSQSGARLAGVHPVSIATADEWAAMVLYWITETLRVADANAALVAANVALTDAAAVLLAAHEGLRSEADEAFAELSVRRAYDARESDLFSVQERIVELSRMARNPWAPVVTHVKERNGNGNH